MSKENPEQVIIIESRFFEYGSVAPEGSRFKGTIDETSLIGYSEYTDASTREQHDNEIGMREDGYLGYTNKSDEALTFSSIGNITENKRLKFKSEIANCFKQKGDLAWELIISMPDYDYAHQNGFDINDDYAEFAYKTLPKIFKAMHFKQENMIWWGDHHSDTVHPHMHIVFLEKHKTRTKGKFSKKELNQIKRIINNEISLKKTFESEMKVDFKEFMQMKDDDFHQIVQEVKTLNLSQNPKIKELRLSLPKTGRLQYNAKNMLPYKKAIDTIIENVLNSKEIKPMYDRYLERLDMLEGYMNDNSRSNISTIKKTEIHKLYSQIGNEILNNCRQKVKTGYVRNGQHIRERYSEKHLKSKVKSLLSQAIAEKERDLQQWAYENGLIID